jgi:hypothetical protein
MSSPIGERLWDVAVELDSTTAIAGVADALAQAGINISSICAAGAGSPLTCHLLVDEPDGPSAALGAAGVAAKASPVAVFQLQNRPGTLAAVAAALNDAGAIVDLIYQATDRGLVIGADDLDTVAAAVAASGRLTTDTTTAGRNFPARA